jgi:hypothetical protein
MHSKTAALKHNDCMRSKTAALEKHQKHHSKDPGRTLKTCEQKV